MSRTDDGQGSAGAGGVHDAGVGTGSSPVGDDNPHSGSGYPGAVIIANEPYAPGRITFVLSHSHPGHARHSHTFTAVLGYYLTISIADPHPRPEALAQPGAEAYAVTGPGPHTDTTASPHTSANSTTDATANASADSATYPIAIADTESPDTNADTNACTDTYDPGPDTDPDPDFDTVFDTKPVPYPVTHTIALTIPDPIPDTVTDPDL